MSARQQQARDDKQDIAQATYQHNISGSESVHVADGPAGPRYIVRNFRQQQDTSNQCSCGPSCFGIFFRFPQSWGG
jgi:hypothetical protein